MDFNNKPIFGMIHLSPCEITGDRVERALREMQILEEEGVNGVIIENYHGSPEDVREVFEKLDSFLKNTKLILGINILPNNFQEALKLANEFGAKFIQMDYVAGTYVFLRSHLFVYEPVFNEARNKYPHIKVLGGVWPKYYEPAVSSILKYDIESATRRADGIVVTGAGTGKETPLDKIKEFRNLCGKFPLIIGAGLTKDNVSEQLIYADGAIVGSCFKPHGQTTKEIKRELVKEFMEEVFKVRLQYEYEAYMKSVTDKYIAMLSDRDSGIPTYKILGDGTYEFGKFHTIDFVNDYSLTNTIIEPSDKQVREKNNKVQDAWIKEKNKLALEFLQENTMSFENWKINIKDKCI